MEVADRWIQKGHSISKVLKIVGIARSTYYYQKNYRVEEKKGSEGRPAPGYSNKEDGQKFSDEQIKEMILEEIAGDAYNYGYRKLTKVLHRNDQLVINKKKCIDYARSWAYYARNGKRKSHIQENWHETVSLQVPINFGRPI